MSNSDSEQNYYGEDEVSSEEIEEVPKHNINSIFKELKESIEIAMESKENEKQKISELLASIQIPYTNKTCPNYFYDILESLRKKKLLDSFVSVIRVKKNSKLLFTIKEAFLKELNILAKIKKENSSLQMIKFIVGNFIYELNKKDKKKLENFMNLKYKANIEYFDDILSMVSKTKNIFTIYICGLCLSIKDENFKNKQKKEFESIFTSFLSSEIFNEENKEINISKLRILSCFLNNLSSEAFFEKIMNECGRLLSRSSKNYEFMSTAFIGADKMIYNDEFIKEYLFKEHLNFLFPSSYESNMRTEQILLSFKNIASNCNLIILLQEILDVNLDSNELYTYSYYFISSIFKIHNMNKEINKKYPINEELLIKSIIFALDNFDKIYGDSPEKKKFINNFFQDFLSSLFHIHPIKIDNDTQKEKISKISSILKPLIKNNQYSNYHNYFYLFPGLSSDKLGFIFDEDFFELFLNLLNENSEAEITEENSANILSLVTCSLNFGLNNKNFKEKSKDDLDKILNNIVNSDLFINNYNKLTKLESICLYLISQILFNEKDLLTEINNDNFLKLLCKSFFKGNSSSGEILIFQ